MIRTMTGTAGNAGRAGDTDPSSHARRSSHTSRSEDSANRRRLTDQRPDIAGTVFDAIFEDNPVGIGIFTSDLRYVRINSALAQMSGLRTHEVVGRRLLDVLPSYHEVATLLTHVAETGVPLVSRHVSVANPASQPDRHHRLLSAYRLLGKPADAFARDIVGTEPDITEPATGEPDATEGDLVVIVSIDVTDRYQAEERAHEANRRLALLAKASEQLGASLDVAATASALVSLMVPDLADHAVVDLVDIEPSGLATTQLRRAAMSHRPDAAEPTVPYCIPGELVPYTDDNPAIQSLRSGRSILIENVHAEDLLIGARDPRVAASLAAVGVRSQVAVPLLARDGVIGVLLLKQSVSGRRFDDDDVAIAAELAARAGVAIDNARRYDREHEIALTLQRSLMREQLSATSELEAVGRYLPAAGGARVGGDWYDLIPLGAGRVALVIGDVMGRGLQAAGVMGQVRAATRTLAHVDFQPRRLMAQVDSIVAELDGQLVTCSYAVYDPFTATLRACDAGHLPLLMRLPNGEVSELPRFQAVPLGVGGIPFGHAETIVPPGAVLAFYSDGLVESRDSDIDSGIARLKGILGSALATRHSLDEVADKILHTLVPSPATHDDDVTLLLVRTPSNSSLLATLVVEPEPSAVSLVRHFVGDTTTTWGVDIDITETVRLLASELVTNAMRHGRGAVTVRLRLGPDHLYLEVDDDETSIPDPRTATDDDEGGRGLQLVSAMANSWGSRPLDHGKSVWCALKRD